MLSDAEMDDLRWKADLIGGCVPVRPEELRALLDEIARLRAEVARLEAGRLRAERIGRAVLLSFGYAPFTYDKWADALERHTLVTPARLLRAISDALKEADDAE